MNDEENAICPHCNTRAAVRECNECVSRFCLSCYAKYHENDKMRHHTFKNVDTTGARFLKCIECESAPATRKCEQCEDVFCKDCYRVVHTNGQLAMHKYTEFKPGSQICVECDADFATIDCKECGDLFCESCSKRIHAKGEMAGHSLKPLDIWVRAILGEDEEYCAECEARVATRVCDQCSDPFCDVCFDNLHSKGLRKKHTWTAYNDTGLASGWQEYWDEDEKKYIYFNTKTKERQTTKPIELMALAERQDVERMQREEMQKEKMESDIAALRRKLDEMNEKRKEALSQVKVLELEKEKRQKVRTALKKGIRSIKTKFMLGNKRRKAEDEIEEEFLRETVIDRERTKDKYESNIMDELSNNRSKLREESYEKAKRDKKKLKREGIAGQLNDEDEDASPEDELFG